jgi:hypothetical protein
MIGPPLLGPSDVAELPSRSGGVGERRHLPAGQRCAWSSWKPASSLANTTQKFASPTRLSIPLVLLELGSFTFGFDRLCEALPRAPTEGSSDGGTLTFGVVQNLALDP